MSRPLTTSIYSVLGTAQQKGEIHCVGGVCERKCGMSLVYSEGTVQSLLRPFFDLHRYTNIVSWTSALHAMPLFPSYTLVARRFQSLYFQVYDDIKNW
jgi:hypothetical protein